MAALAVNGVDGLRASDDELLLPGPSYTADTLDRLRATGAQDHRRFSSSRGRTRSRKLPPGSGIPRSSTSRTSSSSRGRASALSALRQRLPHLKDRMRLPTATAVPDTPCGFTSWTSTTAGRVVDRRSGGASQPACRSRASCRRPSNSTSSSTRSTIGHCLPLHRQITCMAKTERTKPTVSDTTREANAPAQTRPPQRREAETARGDHARGAGGARQEGRRTSSCSTCAARRRSPISSSCAPA